MADKRCKDCGQFLEISSFRTVKGKKYVWTSSYCKPCERERARGYQAAKRSAIECGDLRVLAKKILATARCRARSRGMEFRISEDWIFSRLSPMVCEVTGERLNTLSGGGLRANPYYPSIDRTDNSIGYTKENCKIVSLVYNVAKNEWDKSVILRVAKNLVEKSI